VTELGLTSLQWRVLQAIDRGLNRQRSVTALGRLYKSPPGRRGDPTIGRLAAHSVCRALERRGLVGFIRSDSSQWAVLVACLSDAGIRTLNNPRQDVTS